MRPSRTYELARVHRFTHQWEAAASLQLRGGDATALDAYVEHDRVQPGSLDQHLERIAADWLAHAAAGRTVAVTASNNQQVDTLNDRIQHARLVIEQLDQTTVAPIADGECAHVGETVVTRRNDRRLITSAGETIRNRELWTVTATHADGALTVNHLRGNATVTLPADYLRMHVRLGYVATEHGHQGDTVDVGIALASSTTSHRGLYVAVTRGREDNQIRVVTDSYDLTEARDTLEAILTNDRVDIPAVTQRRNPAAAEQPDRPHAELTWLRPWREQLRSHRQRLADEGVVRESRRTAARAEVDLLQPALDAAQAAWAPYGREIRRLDNELAAFTHLEADLITHAARRAGPHRRRQAQEHATDAARRVDDARRELAAVETDGTPARQRLNQLEARVTNLHSIATPDATPKHATAASSASSTRSSMPLMPPSPTAKIGSSHLTVLRGLLRFSPTSPGTCHISLPPITAVDYIRWHELLGRMHAEVVPQRPGREIQLSR